MKKTMLVTLGDRPAVEVEIPEGKGEFWVYRSKHDHVFASRTPPGRQPPWVFVIRYVRENGDTVYKPSKVSKEVSKKKAKVSYGDYPWEDESAS